GGAWNIPDFARQANQSHMEALKTSRVSVDGDFKISVRPVKISAEDLLLTEASVLAFRIFVVAVYAALFWLLVSFVSGRAGSRFRMFKAGQPGAAVKISDVAGYDGVKTELLEV